MQHILPISYLILIGLTEGVLRYKSSKIMDELNSKSTSNVFGLISIVEFSKAIKKEQNPNKKRKYKKILWLRITLIPIYFIGLIIIIA